MVSQKEVLARVGVCLLLPGVDERRRLLSLALSQLLAASVTPTRILAARLALVGAANPMTVACLEDMVGVQRMADAAAYVWLTPDHAYCRAWGLESVRPRVWPGGDGAVTQSSGGSVRRLAEEVLANVLLAEMKEVEEVKEEEVVEVAAAAHASVAVEEVKDAEVEEVATHASVAAEAAKAAAVAATHALEAAEAAEAAAVHASKAAKAAEIVVNEALADDASAAGESEDMDMNLTPPRHQPMPAPSCSHSSTVVGAQDPAPSPRRPSPPASSFQTPPHQGIRASTPGAPARTLYQRVMVSSDSDDEETVQRRTKRTLTRTTHIAPTKRPSPEPSAPVDSARVRLFVSRFMVMLGLKEPNQEEMQYFDGDIPPPCAGASRTLHCVKCMKDCGDWNSEDMVHAVKYVLQWRMDAISPGWIILKNCLRDSPPRPEARDGNTDVAIAVPLPTRVQRRDEEEEDVLIQPPPPLPALPPQQRMVAGRVTSSSNPFLQRSTLNTSSSRANRFVESVAEEMMANPRFWEKLHEVLDVQGGAGDARAVIKSGLQVALQSFLA
jgi:hypothetical protein